MRLRFPAPIGDRAHECDRVELPGLVLQVLAVEPLPADREAWRIRIAGDAAPERVETPSGWPLAIVVSGERVLGFYELFDRGVVVSLTATDLPRARELLLAADLDRTPREIVALAQLWDEEPRDA